MGLSPAREGEYSRRQETRRCIKREMCNCKNTLQAPIDMQAGGVVRQPFVQEDKDPAAIRRLIAVRKWPLSQCHLQAIKLQ